MKLSALVAALLLWLASCAQPPRPGDALEQAFARGEFPRTTSALLERGGTIVAERYWAGSDAATLHDTRSVGKSVTSLAVGIALGEGRLPSLAAHAFDYLDALRPFAHDGPAKAAITLRDLLTMSSALACDDDADDSPGNERNMYPQRVWARWAVDLPLNERYQRDATGLGPFAYCTAGTFLLGQVLQRATGEPVDRYIESRLLAPLGIREAAWERSPAGEVMTGGMLRLRTRDLAKLGRLVLQRGRWNGTAIVPAGYVAEAISQQRKPNAAADPRGELAYGFLFWGRTYATPCGRVEGWYMSGNGGNHVLALPERDAVAVVTRVHYNQRGMHAQTWRLLEQHLLPELPCAQPQLPGSDG
jgi:CubicO group peptidase (beta-lactamase class C family)